MEATMQLITILQSLRERPRPLSDEENLYLDHITDEIRRAPSDAARWRILEREGINRPDVMAFDQDILATLTTLRRAAMN
jgi:hypothetical protein